MKFQHPVFYDGLMLAIVDNADVLFHYGLLKAAGYVPAQVKLDGVSFERGGGILVDGAIDLPVVGGFDVKLRLVAKLLPDLKTIRLRVVDVQVSGIGSRDLVMFFVKKFAANMEFSGLRFVAEGKDGYLEYRRPQEWILLKDLQTADNRLTVVLQGLDLPLMIRELQAAQLSALEKSDIMADQARAAQLKAQPIERDAPAGGAPYPAPDLKGAVNMTKSF